MRMATPALQRLSHTRRLRITQAGPTTRLREDRSRRRLWASTRRTKTISLRGLHSTSTRTTRLGGALLLTGLLEHSCHSWDTAIAMHFFARAAVGIMSLSS